MDTSRRKAEVLVDAAALVAVTLVVYVQTVEFDFVSLDDPHYVSENPRVLNPTRGDLLWALTSYEGATWQPLTWISLMVDGRFAGGSPRRFHATNVALHVANTLLLFWVLVAATGAVRAGGFVSVLFAIHPLHVESVAWITERKDVLSTFFWLGTMLAYLRYARRPSLPGYATVVLLFLCGLTAKPMLVSLPLVLLLFDYWPLRRLEPGDASSAFAVATPRRLIVEKLPLLLLAATVSVITVQAQSRGGAVQDLEVLPLGLRVSNALVSYGRYIRDMLWPDGLAALYPYPREGLPGWQVTGSLLLLVALTCLALWQARRRPYLVVGWLWYVIALFPVCGIVQIGMQARADRFTYIPLIGLFLIVAWGVKELADRLPGPQLARSSALWTAAVLVTVTLAARAHAQVGTWRDSVTLYRHALEVTTFNARAHHGLGVALNGNGDRSSALWNLREAVRIDPTYAEAQAALAAVLSQDGLYEEALPHFRAALRLKPEDSQCRTDLATALLRMKRVDEATAEFDRALRLDPDNVSAHNNLGVIRARRGEWSEAEFHFREVLRVQPDHEGARRNLERVLRSRHAPG